MGKGMHTSMILIDLKKACDTRDKILVEEVTCLGLKTSVILIGLGLIYQVENSFVAVGDIFSEAGTGFSSGVNSGSIPVFCTC